jgi:hypothetical protein
MTQKFTPPEIILIEPCSGMFRDGVRIVDDPRYARAQTYEYVPVERLNAVRADLRALQETIADLIARIETK